VDAVTAAEQHERRLANARRNLTDVVRFAPTARTADHLARVTVDVASMVVDARNGLFPHHPRALDLLEDCVTEWRKYVGR